MASPKILYVEDNYIISLANCSALRDFGYDVTEAFSAIEAVAILLCRDDLFALVTDIDLGPGEDGFQVARRGRVAHPELAVVFISAASGSRYRSEGVPCSEFIAKPFETSLISAALIRAMPEPWSQASASRSYAGHS
jgi:CheY-like chemotaxis protein